jgi:hypothetical protein
MVGRLLALQRNATMLWRTAQPLGPAKGARERLVLTEALLRLGFHRDRVATDRAARYCRELARTIPNRAAPWLALGQRWLDAPANEVVASDEPLRCFQAALRAEPDCIESRYGLAMILQHRGRADEAAAAYRAVIEQDPGHVAARFRLWCLEKSGGPFSEIGPYRAPGDALLDIEIGNAEIRREDLRKTQQHGSIVIRNSVPRDLIDVVRDLMLPFVRRYDYRKNSTIPYSASPPKLRAALDRLMRDVHLARLLPLLSQWHERGWTPLPNPTRWIQYFPPRPNDRPLGFGTSLHQDHAVHTQQSDWATFWTSFSPCGPGRASTLRVLTVPLRHPIDCSERSHRINTVPFAWVEEFFGGAMVPLTINPGDVVSFGRHTLHDTHFDPNMTGERISFDVRWKTGPSRHDLCTFADRR